VAHRRRPAAQGRRAASRPNRRSWLAAVDSQPPPIRLHDLRHGAATLALAAGVDIKVVSEQLGHSTSTLTRDTYQSVVKQLHHNAADAVAEKIKNKRRKSA
jgi:integrase